MGHQSINKSSRKKHNNLLGIHCVWIKMFEAAMIITMSMKPSRFKANVGKALP